MKKVTNSNLDLTILENAAKYYSELEKNELALAEDICLARWLSELIMARKRITELEWLNSHKLDVNDAMDEGTLQNWYIDSVASDDIPIWTDEHIAELVTDFYVFPKPDNYAEYDRVNAVDYRNNLTFWCHTADNLPYPLYDAYMNLQTDGYGSQCYLVEYNGEYGVALLNEFDYDTSCLHNFATMDDMYVAVKKKSEEMSKNDLLLAVNAKVIVTKRLGFKGCHEILVIVPWSTPVEIFDKVAEYIDSTVYEI